MAQTDTDLIESYLRRQDEAAFLALYDRHAPAMFALAHRLLGGQSPDAADALQDAWMRIVTRLSQFRGESTLRTWLCGFVINCCRERVRGPIFEAEVDRPAPPMSDVGLDLERALASLPPGYRAVIVLHDIEGHTHREIATALQIDEGTSKSQLSRGREALRRLLSSPGPRTR